METKLKFCAFQLSAVYLIVTSNTMKLPILTFLLAICASSFCQKTTIGDISSINVDSVYRKLIPTLLMVREHYPDVPLPSSSFKVFVTKYDNDSIIFSFSDSLNTLLFKKIDKYDKSGCRWWQTIEIFSLTGKLYYREGWKWTCLDINGKRDPDIRYFDAIVYERERFTYDDSGRLKSRIWWCAPIGLREYEFTYKKDKKESVFVRKESDEFWE
jgi:hypothetical protein